MGPGRSRLLLRGAHTPYSGRWKLSDWVVVIVEDTSFRLRVGPERSVLKTQASCLQRCDSKVVDTERKGQDAPEE